MLAEKTNFTITRMVRLLDVSRSGYYAWAGRTPSPASLRRVHIEQKVTFFHGDSDEVYGAPRILADLRADGEVVSRKTVAATMRRLGLVGICPKKWKMTSPPNCGWWAQLFGSRCTRTCSLPLLPGEVSAGFFQECGLRSQVLNFPLEFFQSGSFRHGQVRRRTRWRRP
jgi:hypothetical protein